MYADNAQISHRQLFRQIVTGLLGIYVLTTPVATELSGRQGILSLLSATAVYFFLCIYFVRTKRVFQEPEKYMGRTAGKIFVFLYVSWLWLMGVYLLLVIARITERFLIEGSISWAVILLAGGAAYLGSHQGLERRGRMAEFCFPLLLILLAGMLLLAVFRVKPAYLQEMGPFSFQGWLEGTYTCLCLFLPYAFLPVTLGNVRKAEGADWVIRNAMLLVSGLLSLSLVLLQGSFGLGGYEHKEYPMFDMMAGVQFPGDFLERVDVFWAAAVVFSILFALGSVFFYHHELLVRVKLEKTAHVLAGGILFAAVCCERAGVSEDIFLYLTKKFYLPLFLLLFLYAGLAGRRKKVSLGAAVLLAIVFSMTGCGVSLEDRIFPLSMSADYVNGHYQIIYGIPGLSQITGQKKEENQESEAQAIVYDGKTPKDVEAAFQENQEKYLDMGHIKTLILGEGLLENQEALESLLHYLEEKPSVAGNIYVFASQEIEALMSLEARGEEAVGEYLTGILENQVHGTSKQAVMLQDLYNAWHREEEFPELLYVSVLNKKPKISQYS